MPLPNHFVGYYSVGLGFASASIHPYSRVGKFILWGWVGIIFCAATLGFIDRKNIRFGDWLESGIIDPFPPTLGEAGIYASVLSLLLFFLIAPFFTLWIKTVPHEEEDEEEEKKSSEPIFEKLSPRLIKPISLAGYLYSYFIFHLSLMGIIIAGVTAVRRDSYDWIGGLLLLCGAASLYVFGLKKLSRNPDRDQPPH